MSTWQERFAHKVSQVREAAQDRFEHIADETIAPMFEEFLDFTTQQGLHVTAPLDKPGIRTFKFAITENAYLFMTFRPAGVESCEMYCESFVPNCGAGEPVTERVALMEADEPWARSVFEKALDQFMSSFVESLEACDKGEQVAAPRAGRKQKPEESAVRR